MKKETVIAISLGIFLGIGVALIMVARTRQQETAKTKTISSETNITPKVSLTDNKYQLLEISQPQDSVIIDSETVKIRGKASKDSLIIIQSPIKEVIIKNSNVNFSSDFPLTDGENIIKVSAYPKDQSLRFQEKELKIYQLNEQRLTAVSPTGSTSSSESTPSSAVDRQIQNFKDKIANKEAEMEKKKRHWPE